MKKVKVILAMGIISLFIGLSVSPATAKIVKTDLTQDLEEMKDLIPELMDEMSKATSLNDLIERLNIFAEGCRGHPILTLVMTIIHELLDILNRVNGLRPLKTNAFIMSWGFSNKINPFKENKLQLYRPFTGWCYSGKSNLILNSRTLVVDFCPFAIKMFTGRQIGFMRNFAGIYAHRETTMTQKSYTFFMGKTAAMRGFDLSMLNILGQ